MSLSLFSVMVGPAGREGVIGSLLINGFFFQDLLVPPVSGWKKAVDWEGVLCLVLGMASGTILNQLLIIS